jgi:maleylpyruvate isomerase
MRPRDAIATVIAGHRQVATAVAGLDDDGMRRPSLLPGWSRARVIAHLAHKSRSHVVVFEAARAGLVGNQYPDSQAAADVESEAWSQRPTGELIRLLVDGFAALEDAWANLGDNAWNRRGISSAGERSMVEFVDRHMRDVFVHHVDLGIGYGPADWPPVFVNAELPKRLRDLPERAEHSALLAWLLGRTGAPELSGW